MYAHLIVNGTCTKKTRFFADVKLTECDAAAIGECLADVAKDYDLNFSNCFGFGSGGASVMTGCENGVAALLKRKNPYLVSLHCAAHRLALASSQAADKVKAIAQYQKSLSGIYSYFSHSNVYIVGLREVQRVLEETEIKMKRLYQFRWLSFDITVDDVLQSLPALMTFFEHKAQEGDPTAIGIHRCITTYKFFALTHLVKDILSVITKLCLTFQSPDIDVSLIQPKVIVTIDALDNMKSHNGPCLKDFKTAFANGNYVLYNIADDASQRSSFDLTSKEFIVALKKNCQIDL